jgi:membrane protease subunit HflC
MKKNTIILVALALGAVVFLIYKSTYYVHVTEFAIVTRFGQPRKIINQPGINFKIPFAEEVIIRNKKLRLTSSSGEEFLTQDKKNIVVSWYLLWQITDPLKYFQTVFDQFRAESRLVDVASSSIGAFLGRVNFSDIISVEKGGEKSLNLLETQIKEFCQPVFLRNFGIELQDVRFTRFNFPEQNRQSVFNRMKAERNRIAAKYRAEGEGEATKIQADADREKRDILAKSDRQARELRGEGEAQAAAVYRKAYAQDPEFYKFLRTLEAYEQFVDNKTTLVLPQNSDLWKLLVSGDGKHSDKH